jgi:transcriptional regulator with XRE-family HTH domain
MLELDGANFRAAVFRAGQTQRRLCKEIQLDPSTLSAAIHGYKRLPRPTVEALAMLLRIAPAEILRR